MVVNTVLLASKTFISISITSTIQMHTYEIWSLNNFHLSSSTSNCSRFYLMLVQLRWLQCFKWAIEGNDEFKAVWRQSFILIS